MIVLALVAMGRDYGLAMEAFIEDARMRLWAKIGSSTIYKALKDLEHDRCLTGRLGSAKRGPGKRTFRMTARGVRELEARIEEALSSRAPVYSDRIAGLIFSASISRDKARPLIEMAIAGTDGALEEIKREKSRKKGDEIAQITLDYYRSIYRAEQKAMAAMLARVM